jgi:hypothetical protein
MAASTVDFEMPDSLTKAQQLEGAGDVLGEKLIINMGPPTQRRTACFA